MNLDLLALTVRHKNAVKLMDAGQISGPEALALIVCPPQEVLEASLTAAGGSSAPVPHVRDKRLTAPRMKRQGPKRVNFNDLMAQYST